VRYGREAGEALLAGWLASRMMEASGEARRWTGLKLRKRLRGDCDSGASGYSSRTAEPRVWMGRVFCLDGRQAYTDDVRMIVLDRVRAHIHIRGK
jgi:hypothetical protein